MKRILSVLGLVLATAVSSGRRPRTAFLVSRNMPPAAPASWKRSRRSGRVLGAATPASDAAFRQGHDFVYFTGVQIPDAFLIIDGVRKESLLFFTMTEKEADGEGLPLDLIKDAKDYTGIEKVLKASNSGRP